MGIKQYIWQCAYREARMISQGDSPTYISSRCCDGLLSHGPVRDNLLAKAHKALLARIRDKMMSDRIKEYGYIPTDLFGMFIGK
jgi:hypothetical protein